MANVTEDYPNPSSFPALLVKNLTQLKGGLIEKFRSSALAAEVMTAGDNILGLTNDALRTVSVPGAAPSGTSYQVVDTSGSVTAGHTITITPTSGQIHGAANAVITPGTNKTITLLSDGTNYWVVAKN